MCIDCPYTEYCTLVSRPGPNRGSVRSGTITYVLLFKSFTIIWRLTQRLVDTSLVFWSPEVKVGERAVFQLSLAAPPDVYISNLPFSSLAIYFGDDTPPLNVRHNASEDGIPLVQRVELGHIAFPLTESGEEELATNLRWRPGGIIVFTGTVESRVPTTISVNKFDSSWLILAYVLPQISKLVLTLKESSWWIELPLATTGARSGRTQTPRWLSSIDPVKFVTMYRDGLSGVSSVA